MLARSPHPRRRLGRRMLLVAGVAAVTSMSAGCGSTVDPASLEALSADPAMAVRPQSGSLVESRDSFECLDRTAGEQPTLYRGYVVTEPPDDAVASVRDDLIRLGWTSDLLGYAFTKVVDGQIARITVGSFGNTVGLNGDITSVDYCA